MPIPLKCRSCEHRWKVGDQLAGRKVKCPECGKVVLVPDDDEAPRVAGRRSELDDDGEESPSHGRSGEAMSKRNGSRRPKRSKKGAPVGLIAGLALGGVLLIGGAIVAVIVLRGEFGGQGAGAGGAGGGGGGKAVVSDNPSVTRENFKRIQRDMTVEQVEQILGKGVRVPRGEVSRAIHVAEPPGGFGNDTTTIKWVNKKDVLLLEFSRIGVMAGWYVTEKEDGSVSYILLGF